MISELYYPETTSTGYILSKIAEALSKDFQVKVLCAWPSCSRQSIKAPRREIHNGVRIQRCISTTFNKDIFILRLFNLVTSSLSIFLCSLFRFKPGDRVLVVTNPPALPFFIRIACGLKRSRCILLVHDVYPELLIAVKKLKAENFMAKTLLFAGLTLYRSMEHIIILGRDMKELVQEKLREGGERVTVITNWADIDIVQPSSKDENSLILEHRLDKKLIVLYAGNMGYPHDIETIIQCAEKLRTREDIQFLFIGSGVKKKWLDQSVLDKQLKNVKVIPSLPRESQSVFLNCCDIGLISLVQGMKGISVPSRLYNLLASGRPVIALVDPESEVGLVVKEKSLGWTVSPGNPDLLADILVHAREHPNILTEMGERARSVSENAYSLEHIVSKYRQLLNGIT